LAWSACRAQPDGSTSRNGSRRLFFLTARSSIVLLVVAGTALGSAGAALAATDDAPGQEATVWLTGKAPRVPGQKPRDKNDVRGTRRDPNFLRSVSDCKNQCQNTAGPDGLARTKEECLSDCQDICCTTYEQCTFAIVPRI